MRPDQSILVNLSGRGDKDIGTVADLSNADFYCRPSCRARRSRAASSWRSPPVTGGAAHEPHLRQPLAALKAQRRTALIPYVTAGFPYPDITPELMHGMVAAGADMIELGVPFSDPSADGAVIQKAGDKALAAGIGLVQVLEMVRVFRRKDTTTPVVLMGYANPIERYDQRHLAPAGQRVRAGGGPGRCGWPVDRRLPAGRMHCRVSPPTCAAMAWT
jgi:hypothetical protein